MTPTIKLKNLNMQGMIADLNKIADSITDKLSSQLSSNKLYALLTNGIYNSGESNRIRNKQQPKANEQMIPNHENCTAKNFKAIADVNFKMYEHSIREGAEPQVYQEYLKTWQHAEEKAHLRVREKILIRKSTKTGSRKLKEMLEDVAKY